MIFITCLNLPSNTYAAVEELKRLSQRLLSNCFSQHDRTVTSIFDTINQYEVFLARPKSHNLRTETKCRKLSPEGFCEIPPQKQRAEESAVTDERQRKNWNRPARTSAW